MEDLRCVVTGGAGFIGSHITETLLENNVSKVTIIDNMTTGNIENLKNHWSINCISVEVFAYVEHDHLPLCRNCYKLYDKNEINAGQLREKRREKRAVN